VAVTLRVDRKNMDHYLNPEFDFSLLDEDELWRMGNVTLGELESVIRSGRTFTENIRGWPLHEYRYFAVGISRYARIFFMLLKYANDKICFLEVNFAH
jgi:hypothetical protein